MFNKETQESNKDFYEEDADFLNDFDKTIEINKLSIENAANNNVTSLYKDKELSDELYDHNSNNLSFPPYPKGEGER